MAAKDTSVALPPTYIRSRNAPIRCLGALAVVWALSFAAAPAHLTALAAAVWIIATLVLVPIGKTLTDRIVGFMLLAAAPAVLIAWFTPFVPWLVSPPVLTALLGTLVALAWGMGWTRRPVTQVQDWVTIGMGVLTTGFFWLPFAGGGLVRAIGVMSDWLDTSAHYGLWRAVWANHGYAVFNTLSDPEYWGLRTYPQGSHVLLADIGTVLTGDSNPLNQMDQSVALFAILVALLSGVLALVTAWSVDRLSRSRNKANLRRVVIFQVLAVLLVAIGPGSVVSVQSLSFTAGLVVVIPSMALAATAQRSPRLSGLLIGASLIAAAAVYPICALTAFVVWPIYLWTSRGFWLASNRRRWYAAGWTAIVALFCTPAFALLVLRNVDHGWETVGYFQVLNWVVYASIAILLAFLIACARGRLPRVVEYAVWVAAILSIALAADGILQWLKAGDPSYYTVKTMYLGWMLSVIAVGAGLASIRRRRASTVLPARHLVLRLMTGLAAGVFLVGSLVAAVLLDGVDQKDPLLQSWTRAVSKEAWIIANAHLFEGYGSLAVQTAQYAAEHDGVTVAVPCYPGYRTETGTLRWATFLSGGMNEQDLDVLSVTCLATREAPLAQLPEYLKAHPQVRVNALVLDPNMYDYTLRVKDFLKLSNLEVIPPFDDGEVVVR